jgi:hypothetical protein
MSNFFKIIDLNITKNNNNKSSATTTSNHITDKCHETSTSTTIEFYKALFIQTTAFLWKIAIDVSYKKYFFTTADCSLLY